MRRLLHLGGWLVLLPLAGLLAVWWLGSTRIPFDWLWAYAPYLYLPAWLVVVLAVVIGARVLGMVAALVGAAHLAMLLPALTGEPVDGIADLRVASANVLVGNDDLVGLASELSGIDADVLVLQEVTPRLMDALDGALGYPHSYAMLRDDPLGAVVFSRFPLSDRVELDAGGLPMITAIVDVHGRPIRLWDVHTTAPSSRRGRDLRDAMLRSMIDLRRAEALPLLAIGDYNATAWHPTFDALVDATGLRDAHDEVGRGLRGTWKGLPLFETPIDHVLLSEHFDVLDVRNGEGRGSDHRPVVVDLRFSER